MLKSNFFQQIFFSDNNRFSIIIEDDGRVAYAYLLDREKIVGDVWLYNNAQTPTSTNWNNRNEMPFLNPEEFVKNERSIKPILSEKEVNVLWNKDNEKIEATIYINDELIALLRYGAKPGWSSIVKKNGPLAKILHQTVAPSVN